MLRLNVYWDSAHTTNKRLILVIRDSCVECRVSCVMKGLEVVCHWRGTTIIIGSEKVMEMEKGTERWGWTGEDVESEADVDVDVEVSVDSSQQNHSHYPMVDHWKQLEWS